MSSPFMGEIRILPYSYAPRDWAACNGQLMSISQNTALFSILGITYGGDGRTTFGLPNLVGRAPVHQGQSPGLSPYSLGQLGGTETVPLAEVNLPAHTHNAYGEQDSGKDNSPADDFTGTYLGGRPVRAYKASPASTTLMASEALATSGQSQGHENRQPFLTLAYAICVNGIYPQRN